MTSPRRPNVRPLTDKRRRRIERELQALHAMQSHLNTKDIVCAVLTIPALALLCFIVGYKLHMFSESLWIAVAAALVCGAGIWALGRRWFLLATLIVIALCLVAFEDAPDLDLSWDGGPPDRKTRRRLKLEQAINRRKALLGIPASS